MYEYYFVTCRSNLRGHCGREIDLPGDPIFVLDAESQMDTYEPKWPQAEWKAEIACPHCGGISEYNANHVEFYHADEAAEGTSYLNVTFECFHSDCHVPVEFYVVDMLTLAMPTLGIKIWDGEFDAELWSRGVDWLEEIRTGRFQGKCVRGHELKRIPKNRYTITRKRGHLPSLHDRLKWGRIAS